MGPLEIKGIILGFCVVAGMLSLWLGYRLYLKGVIEKGRVDASGHGVSITLKDYGPGVVFALFGAAIIVFAISRPLTSNSSKTTRYVSSRADAAGPSPAEAIVPQTPQVEEQTSTAAAAAAYPAHGTARATEALATSPPK